LYEIDTEAESTVEAAIPAPTTAPVSAAVPESEPTPAKAEAPSDTSTSSSAAPRVPSIKFLGKEGWRLALTPEPEFVIPATYGRLDFSEEEIEALLSGGANLAPELQEYSTGAVFSA
jgi:hypothetical protein